MRLAVLVRRALLSVALLAATSACGPDEHQLEQVRQRAGHGEALPPEAIGGGVDPATGRPYGYPADVPILEGAVPVSGGVVPGSVTTAIVRYRTPFERTQESLRTALAQAGFELLVDEPSVSGGRRFRARKGEREVSFVLTPEGDQTRVDVIARDTSAGSRPEPR